MPHMRVISALCLRIEMRRLRSMRGTGALRLGLAESFVIYLPGTVGGLRKWLGCAEGWFTYIVLRLRTAVSRWHCRGVWSSARKRISLRTR